MCVCVSCSEGCQKKEEEVHMHKHERSHDKRDKTSYS